jgi:hypothetical protein
MLRLITIAAIMEAMMEFAPLILQEEPIHIVIHGLVDVIIQLKQVAQQVPTQLLLVTITDVQLPVL